MKYYGYNLNGKPILFPVVLPGDSGFIFTEDPPYAMGTNGKSWYYVKADGITKAEKNFDEYVKEWLEFEKNPFNA